eukprot:4253311-Karenia_brevis.AAC.1
MCIRDSPRPATSSMSASGIMLVLSARWLVSHTSSLGCGTGATAMSPCQTGMVPLPAYQPCIGDP